MAGGERRDGGGILPTAAMVSTGVSGSVILALLPLLVGLLIDRLVLPLATAGDIAGLRMSGATIGCLLIVPLTRRIDWRLIAGASLVAILIGNTMSMLVHDAGSLAFWQGVVGLGEGATAINGAALASSQNPDRGFGILGCVSLSLGSIGYFICPRLAASYGLAGLIVPMMLVATTGLLLLRWFPPSGRGEIDPDMPAPGLLDGRSLLGLLTMGVFFLGLATIWSCVERVGVWRGYSQVDVGQAVGSLNLIFGLAGAGLAVVFGNRLGHRFPVAAAMGLSLLSFSLFGIQSWFCYLAAIALTFLAWMAAFSFIMGLLAEIDGSGRLAVAGLVVQTGCFAAGPALGTRLLGTGLFGLQLFAIACSVGAISLTIVVTARRYP